MRHERKRAGARTSRGSERAPRECWIAALAAGVFASASLVWFEGPRAPATELGALELPELARAPAVPPLVARVSQSAPRRVIEDEWLAFQPTPAPESRVSSRSRADTVLAEDVAAPAPRGTHRAPNAPTLTSERPAAPSAAAPSAAAPDPATPPAKSPPKSTPAPRTPPARPKKAPPPRDDCDYPRGIGSRFLPGGAGVPKPGSAGSGTPGGGGGPTSGNPGGPSSGVPAPPSVPSGLGRGGAPGEHPELDENPFELTRRDTTSTFSIDVDTASYALVRRFLAAGVLPPRESVRIEECLNTFRYDDPAPDGDEPLSLRADVASCPWAPTHRLVRIGLRGRELAADARTESNLVFLIDVSGSMDAPDKLPLLVRALKLLVQQLDERDTLAIVTYAGESGLALPATSCAHQRVIANALDTLAPGGSTNASAGIELAYELAAANFTRTGQNRVILCTDGDFNVGTTSLDGLQALIERQRKSGVFLSVLGFGRDNTADATMELLADKGDGNYAFIDTFTEARKVLAREFTSTLVTVAKDVKLQVEFDPARVRAWRLIGYENRVLADADFDDDRRDAGELGAGHTVTALYEIVPAGVAFDGAESQGAQSETTPVDTGGAAFDGEIMKLRLRYKRPGGEFSQFRTWLVRDTEASWQAASTDFKFAAAVAAFGLVLRGSAHAGSFTLRDVLTLAVQGVGADADGDRAEFVELVRTAQRIASAPSR